MMGENTKSQDEEVTEKLVDKTPAEEIKTSDSIQMQPTTNGDTMINIAEVSHAFVGMGKEELMKFANDPFWVKLRWFLFGLFWLIWLAMLGGAIAIIFLAPKCSLSATADTKPELLINLEGLEKESKPGEFFNDLVNQKYLEQLGTDYVLFDNIMELADNEPGQVIDFMNVNQNLGTLESLKSALQTFKAKGIKTILKIIPNFTSRKHEWFQKSVNKELPFKDYYIWFSTPNNWLSLFGGSAWEYDDLRKENYLHQFQKTQPDLNFRNEEVVNYFSKVFKHWIDVGFTGIHLDKVQYLIEDQDLKDEQSDRTAIGAVHDQYLFWNHARTTYQEETLNVLKIWSETIKNNSGLLSIEGITDFESFDADLLFRPYYLKQEFIQKNTVNSTLLKKFIEANLNQVNQTWLWEAPVNPNDELDASLTLRDRIKVVLDTLFSLLPGKVLLRQQFLRGDESKIVPSPAFVANGKLETESNWLEYFKMISKLRQETNIQNYPVQVKTIENRNVLVLTGGESNRYILLCNFALSPMLEFGLEPLQPDLKNMTILASSSPTNLPFSTTEVPGDFQWKLDPASFVLLHTKEK